MSSARRVRRAVLAAGLVVLLAVAAMVFGGAGNGVMPLQGDARGPAPTAAASVDAPAALPPLAEPAERKQVLAPLDFRVVDTSGRPVSGIDVELTANSTVAGGRFRSAPTNAEGVARFLLPPTEAPWTVVANKALANREYSFDWLEVSVRDDRAQAHTLKLAPRRARLRVHVCDDVGAPIANALVEPRCYNTPAVGTDAAGWVEFANLPAGPLPIRVHATPATRGVVSFPDVWHSVETHLDQCAQIELKMTRMASLTVRLPTAIAERAVAIELRGPLSVAGLNAVAKCLDVDADGGARFDELPPGDYVIWASFPTESDWLHAFPDAVDLAPGAQAEHVVGAQRSEGVLRGRVLDDGSLPLANLVVMTRWGSSPRLGIFKHAVTDAAGWFTIRGLPVGDVLCSVQVEGIQGRNLQHLGGPVRSLSLRCPDEGIVLRLRAGHRIAGRVTDSLGNAVAGATIALQHAEVPGTSSTRSAADSSESNPGLARGEFEFKHLAPGTYELWVEEGEERVVTRVVVAGGQDDTVGPIVLVARK